MPKDPMILYSYVNTQLRDCYPTLAKLCEDLEWKESEVLDSLAKAGFSYDGGSNRFY